MPISFDFFYWKCRKNGEFLLVNDDFLLKNGHSFCNWRYQAFEYYKPALQGGLSSRCIMGESGPMHLVTDAVSLDARLVPLWRAMAEYADAHSSSGGGRGPPAGGPTASGSTNYSAEEAERVLAAHFATQQRR